ncbi:DUF6417 family protein [Streptomyces hundungensis]|uniref:DUF6417 family protein n=1 Tax=Streptomyces hundungensis TaxID=1077946 RepID=UPI0024822D48|nr:DUF6417 family protein [Streptomyces hundungensis]
MYFTPAPGLEEQIRAAVHDRALGRWLLCLTQGQMESGAYGLWLHAVTRSAAEANRFGREYDIIYRPATDGSRSRTADCLIPISLALRVSAADEIIPHRGPGCPRTSW